MPPKTIAPRSTVSLFNRHMGRSLLAIASVAILESGAHAQSTWQGAAGGAWQTSTNWSPTGTPTATTIAEFNSGAATPTTGTSSAAAGAIWDATGVSGLTQINGTGTLTLAGNLTVNGNTSTAILLDNSANNGLTISAPITLTNGNSTSFRVNNAGTLTIQTGTLNLGTSATTTLTLAGNNSAGNIAISSPITGSGVLVVNTSGTATLSGSNNYTGATSLLGGTLVAASANAIGSNMTLGASSGSTNATLLATGTGTYGKTITVAAGSTGTLTVEGQTNSQTFNNTITLNNNLTVDNLTSGQTTTFAGAITSASNTLTVAKGAGSGSVTLTGSLTPVILANNGAGTLTWNDGNNGVSDNATGTFTFKDNSSGPINVATAFNGGSGFAQTITNTGTGTGTTTLSGALGAGATITENSSTSPLLITASTLAPAALNVTTGTLLLGNGTAGKLTGNTTPATISSNGTLVLNQVSGASTLGAITDNGTINSMESVPYTLSNVISGTGNLVQNGLGTLTLGALNTYSGTTTINSGMVAVNLWNVVTNSLTTTSGSSTVTLPASTGTLLAVGETLFSNAAFGSNVTINSLSTASGTTTLVLSGSAVLTGTTTATNFGTTNDGLGANTNGAGSLVINGGTLGYESLNTGVVTNRLFTVGPNGAGIDMSGVPGTGSIWFVNSGALAYSTPNATETLTLSGNKGIAYHVASPLGNMGYYNLFSPQITDNGSGTTTLVKNGAGLWVLGGANNTYSGGTVVNGGVLEAQTPGSLGSGAVTVASGATVVLNLAGTTYSTGAAEFTQNTATDPNSLMSFIDNRTSGFAPGSSLAIDPTDLNSTTSGINTNSASSGTATINVNGDQGTHNINLNNINFGRYNISGNTSNSANLAINANLNLGSGGFFVTQTGVNANTELAGNNSYTGTTVLSMNNGSAAANIGYLILGSNTALGNASSAGTSEILIQSGSGIALDTSVYTSNAPANAYGITAPIVFSPGVNATTGPTIGDTLTVGNGTAGSENINFQGSVTGSDPISGFGQFSISDSTTGTAQFSGPIYINDGSSNSAASIENFQPIPFGAGTDILVSGNIADAPNGSVGGIGEMTNMGQSSATITLTGNNTFSGPVAIFRGTLQVQTLGNYTNGTPNAQPSSLGSPTSAANGVIATTAQSVLSINGNTNETSNRSFVMSAAGTGTTSGSGGNFILDYSGTGKENIAGLVAPAPTALALTDTLVLQGSTNGSGEISGLIANSSTSTFTVATLAGQASGSTTLTVQDPMGIYFGTGVSISGAGIANGTTVSAYNGDQITLSTATTGSITPGETLQVNGAATATVSLVKQGTGTWELANTANTYTGPNTITGGVLQVTHLANEGAGGGTASSIGVSGNAATNLIINGGTLQYIGSGDTTDRNFQIGQTTGGGTGTLDASGTGSLVLTGSPSWGTASQTRTLVLSGTNTGQNTLAGTIADNGTTTGGVALTKNGAGTWVLTGQNTYSGITTINGGVLSVSSISNFGTTLSLTTTAGSSTVTLASTTGLVAGQAIYDNPNIPNGATISNVVNSGTIVISTTAGVTAGSGISSVIGNASNLGVTAGASNAYLVINGGTLQYTGAGETTNHGFSLGTSGGALDASGTGTIDFTGGITISGTSAARTLTLTGTNTGTNTLAGLLADDSGSGTIQTSVLKTGAGTWYLNGANTFTGAVAVNSGVLGINSVAVTGTAQSLGKGTGAVTLGVANTSSGTLLYTGATGTLGMGVTALGNGSDTIQNSGAGLLTLAGTLTKSNTVLTLNGGANGIKVTGQITGGTTNDFNSDLNIVNGVTTLSGSNNNYTGPTNIFSGGTLKLGVANAVPTGSVINIGNAADGTVTNTFDLAGFNQTVATVNSISNTGATNVDTITNSATGTGTATLTLSGVNSDSTASNGTFAGTITNGATAKTALSVYGGTQTLTTANTYSGGTSVTGGTLLANNTSGSATGNGTLSVSGGGTFGGTGASSGTGFTIGNSGTVTTPRANVLVGMSSITDTNTTKTLTLLGSGASTIQNANLTFNLDASNIGSGTELSVGNTNIAFGTNTGSVQFTLNIQNETVNYIPLDSGYVLVAGTGVTTDIGGVSGGQYTGLTLGTVTQLGGGATATVITGGNMQVVFGSAFDTSNYGNGKSFLVLYQSGGVDDIVVTVVPEPGTWALMLGGLAMLVFWQRRKNKQN